ncbi:hypothetical protein AAC03nite_17200 [Alicyclobacillus acidoterrestris]|nr:hypothetical protein AAC03nite_17200 [Alicyclobacillus acidoterrestris]
MNNLVRAFSQTKSQLLSALLQHIEISLIALFFSLVIAIPLPVFGIGTVPAVIALVAYALLPLLRNTYTGIKEVDPSLIEAARAMGMNTRKRLLKVELPLAMPVILAGNRTATIIH